MGTGALLGATKKLKEKASIIAAHLLRETPDLIEFREGNAVVRTNPEKKIPLWQIANAAWVNNALLPKGMEPGLVEYTFGGRISPFPTRSGGLIRLSHTRTRPMWLPSNSTLRLGSSGYFATWL